MQYAGIKKRKRGYVSSSFLLFAVMLLFSFGRLNHGSAAAFYQYHGADPFTAGSVAATANYATLESPGIYFPGQKLYFIEFDPVVTRLEHAAAIAADNLPLKDNAVYSQVIHDTVRTVKVHLSH